MLEETEETEETQETEEPEETEEIENVIERIIKRINGLKISKKLYIRSIAHCDLKSSCRS